MNKAKVLIIVGDGFTDSEFTYALDRCREEDFEVYVATLTGKDAIGEKGWKAKADFSASQASSIVYGNSFTWGHRFLKGPFDILILPGGVKSIEKVRQDDFVIGMVLNHSLAGRIIATMCHGAQLLIEADLCRNRLISGYYSIKKDIENAGADYCLEVATSGNIVTAPHYDYNGKWMRAVIELWKQKNGDSSVQS